MATPKTTQKDLAGGYQFNVPIKKEVLTGRDVYPFGSIRLQLEDKYSPIIHEDLTLGSQVSYVGNRSVPFLRIFRYKEAFALKFVNYCLSKFEATTNDYVFDPFSGLGTTVFTSTLNGIPSVGVDKLPIAYFASKDPAFIPSIEEK